MALSKDGTDWERLKSRILHDLGSGKTQDQIRKDLEKDPDTRLRVSISKYGLERLLKKWNYRHSLHVTEWKVVGHRIKKRRESGKPDSQVLVNGYQMNSAQVDRAIERYCSLVRGLPSPQIPPELSHHCIEVRTPPSSPRALTPQPLRTTTAGRKIHENPAVNMESSRLIWPQTLQWRELDLSIRQFVVRSFIPTYVQNEKFREAFNVLGRRSPVRRLYQGDPPSAPPSRQEASLPDRDSDPSPDFYDHSAARDTMLRLSNESKIGTEIAETLLGLLYDLSNQSLTDAGRSRLRWMIDAPEWDIVIPHLRNKLTLIDKKILEAITEGLLKESIGQCHRGMLKLALDLGADPMQSMKHFERSKVRPVLFTALESLCKRHRRRTLQEDDSFDSEDLILTLLERDPEVSNSTLSCLIYGTCHAMAEDLIRSQPDREIDFSITVSDLKEGSWLSGYERYGTVTPLLLACSDRNRSAQKISLVRCLLERNAKASLEAMIAAAKSCDENLISLLYQHGAPVNGLNPRIGSPLTAACEALRSDRGNHVNWAAIPLLLKLGASPKISKDTSTSIEGWRLSPLHLLGWGLSEPDTGATIAMESLLKYDPDINSLVRVPSRLRRSASSSKIGGPGPLDVTALEWAIHHSQWKLAHQILSADCELTGREILFVNTSYKPEWSLVGEGRQVLTHLIGALLRRAPFQTACVHWSGLTVLQRAIQNDHEDMIRLLFANGVTPMPSDFLYMFGKGLAHKKTVCRLSSNIQMTLVLAAGSSELSITDISTIRLILVFACPRVVRHILLGCPDVYDSEGLCYMVARIASNDRITYLCVEDTCHRRKDPEAKSLTMDDLRTLIARRTASNSHKDWENIAVTIAARAGRADILRTIMGSNQLDFDSSGLIPLFFLKEFLSSEPLDAVWLPKYASKLEYLGLWAKHCRMDDPETKCSPLTAAAMVMPESAAEAVVDLLLARGYQPDGWTILVACRQGYMSILRRLRRLQGWPHVLRHRDRLDWCPAALEVAVHASQTSTVSFLLDRENMVDAVDLCPSRPFCFLQRYGYESQGVQPFGISLPRTALQRAVEKDNLELVTLLLNAGADVNAPAAMDSGATALQIACIQGSLLMVQFLISQGADPCAAGATKHGRTAIQGAAEHGRKDIVDFLLEHSILKATEYRDQLVTAIIYAEKSAQHVVASILRERLLPQWNSEDEALKESSDDWESSSEHSVCDEFRDKLLPWEKALGDFARVYTLKSKRYKPRHEK